MNIINNAKRSLGVVRPSNIDDLLFKPWEKDDEPHIQSKLFKELEESKLENREDFDYNIKLRYICPTCSNKRGYHEQTILEWSADMGLKNNPSNSNQFYDNSRFGNENYNYCIFIKNMNSHRSYFMITSVIPVKKDVLINSTLWEFPKVAQNFEPANS